LKKRVPHKKDNMCLTFDISSFSTSYYQVNPASTVMIYHHAEEI